ncbi:MAG: hypothetical protein JKY42_07995 [Flavobacteriales bacterium]|nr:hypothetical protein [Flavobacteriales bacterium]
MWYGYKRSIKTIGQEEVQFGNSSCFFKENMKHYLSIIFCLSLSVYLVSCSENVRKKKEIPNAQEKQEKIVTVEEVKVPTKAESSVSNLFVAKDGQVYLTWIETSENENSTLYFSNLNENKWASPTQIDKGNNWIVNWADFPSLTQFGGNSLAVNYLVESDRETFAYGVNIVISNDNGKNWNKPFMPHTDGTKTEHGFVSLVPYGEDQFMAIWLDGRKYEAEQEPDEMTLRAVIIGEDGVLDREFVIDNRVCDCCATSATVTDDGIIVVYRDRSENEVRDIYSSTFKNGEWSEPNRIARDDWEISGCPVNGPAIEADGNNVAVAWYTAAKDNAKVKIAFSSDFGSTYTSAIMVNTTRTLGRVDVTYLNSKKVVVCWMEEENDITYIKARSVNSDCSEIMGKPIVITQTEGSRSSGFPKMVKTGKDLVFSWTESGESSAIKTAMVSLSVFE